MSCGSLWDALEARIVYSLELCIHQRSDTFPNPSSLKEPAVGMPSADADATGCCQSIPLEALLDFPMQPSCKAQKSAFSAGDIILSHAYCVLDLW